MEYHVVCLENDAIVRPKVDGISDIEFKHGCRIFYTEATTQYQIIEEVRYMFFLLNKEQWKEMINDLEDPCSQNVPSNNFKSSKVVYDKWDTIPIIY
jgi:hypothetical protein